MEQVYTMNSTLGEPWSYTSFLLLGASLYPPGYQVHGKSSFNSAVRGRYFSLVYLQNKEPQEEPVYGGFDLETNMIEFS